jgi:hypothetical protein
MAFGFIEFGARAVKSDNGTNQGTKFARRWRYQRLLNVFEKNRRIEEGL